jgi:hypothetical protein
VTLDGAILSDNDNGHYFRIPDPTVGVADTTLAAGAVMAYRVDDPALGNAEFGLGDNDKARLFQSNAVDLGAATAVDSQTWSTRAQRTYGLNGSGVWASTDAGTFGTANTFGGSITADLSDVVLNEVVTNGDTTHGDWVELLNTTGATMNISGMVIEDGSGNRYTIPATTNLAPYGTAGDTYVLQTTNTAGWGLGRPDSVQLYRSTAATLPVDHTDWEAHPVADPLVGPFASFARQSAGFGDWATDTSPSYNAHN